MRIRILPLSRRQTTAPVNPNVSFIVEQPFAGNFGCDWSEDSAKWPIGYKSYTSEDAFCEALKAMTTTDTVATPNGIVAHTLTLQPYTKPGSTGNEDRHTVQCWEFPSGQWTFVGVFDGAYDTPLSKSWMALENVLTNAISDPFPSRWRMTSKLYFLRSWRASV